MENVIDGNLVVFIYEPTRLRCIEGIKCFIAVTEGTKEIVFGASGWICFVQLVKISVKSFDLLLGWLLREIVQGNQAVLALLYEVFSARTG